jgi:hypothetical protein
MHPSRRALLDKILASRHFARTQTLGKILDYVCERTAESGESIKEYHIATEVLHRDQSFDPKLDPVVRVSMSGLRERLQRYFDEPGNRDSLRLVIPKGRYRAQFIETEPSHNTDSGDDPASFKSFWGAYLEGRSSLLVHTEPLFFRDGWQTYVRNLYVNNPHAGSDRLVQRLPELKGRCLQASFHYLDAGEVNSMFVLLNSFHHFGVNVGVRNARTASWNEIRDCNLVLLGSTRTNSFIDMLQEETDFVVGEDDIRNLSPVGAELSSYQGERYQDAKLSRNRDYVLITRRPGASRSSVITMVAANHGRAIEGAVSYLTTPREITKLLSRMGIGHGSCLPMRFQILLKVEMIDSDDEIIDVELVSYRLRQFGRAKQSMIQTSILEPIDKVTSMTTSDRVRKNGKTVWPIS